MDVVSDDAMKIIQDQDNKSWRTSIREEEEELYLVERLFDDRT